jgi:uncharacterized protein (DUF608 family)
MSIHGDADSSSVKPEASNCRCQDSCCPPVSSLDRRTFVQLVAGGAGIAAAHANRVIAGPFGAGDTIDHFIPIDKKLDPAWVQSLFARGKPQWYSGRDLETIGMPVGGLCAGQVYLTGDGRLVYWDIFNSNHNTGFGAINYKVGRKPTEVVTDGKFTPANEVGQGVAMRVRVGGQTLSRPLDAEGFPGVRFCGEYPIGMVRFDDDGFPVEASLEAFSPFIPLNAEDSTLPAVVLNYRLKNRGKEDAEITLTAWLDNAVLSGHAQEFAGQAVRRNRAVKENDFAAVVCNVQAGKTEKRSAPPTVFADFEGGNYGGWIIEGEAFGAAPAKGTLPNQQAVKGYRGESLVNTFSGGDEAHGKLTSPAFKIERPWISMLIGGGSFAEKTCVNLLVDGKVVRTATGKNSEELQPTNWHVADLVGKEAKIEIVDAESGGWGHINVDQIEFRDEPLPPDGRSLERQGDFGSMALAVLGSEGTFTTAATPNHERVEAVLSNMESAPAVNAEGPLEKPLRGIVGKSVTLKPGEQTTISFVVCWHMPNNYYEGRFAGNYYAKRFADAEAVVRRLAADFDRLTRETKLWHDVYYDSTLPRWLLSRIGATVCNLATTTCQWWRNGRFWAWEGAGCCHGTCGHVWNYEHALARLFPELERSVRTMQDFAPGIGFNPETGSIGFRGEGWTLWAGDAQGGYILKAYREHQASRDDDFLNQLWPNIRKAIEFLIDQDKNADGLIEGQQHQTYDENFFGANTFVGSLYLGALRAAEEMAREVGEPEFAERCRAIFEAGRENSVKRLFNGEYFTQEVDLKQHPDWQYADGCLADHLFGQSWAHQVSLGYIYPKETVLKALESIWKYNWAPDIAAQNKRHEPERWFAREGEAGLFTCTWPKSKHLGPKSTRYRDEVWTGTEYQVASHLAWEGMLTECLAMCRAVEDRYHPSKRNPFNEIECGDHYARSLASWGVLTALSGFEYHGPRGHLGFAPRLSAENFKAVFTAADGWGAYSQQNAQGTLSSRIELKWGELRLRSLQLRLASGRKLESAEMTLAGQVLPVTSKQVDSSVRLKLRSEARLEPNQPLDVELRFS